MWRVIDALSAQIGLKFRVRIQLATNRRYVDYNDDDDDEGGYDADADDVAMSNEIKITESHFVLCCDCYAFWYLVFHFLVEHQFPRFPFHSFCL